MFQTALVRCACSQMDSRGMVKNSTCSFLTTPHSTFSKCSKSIENKNSPSNCFYFIIPAHYLTLKSHRVNRKPTIMQNNPPFSQSILFNNGLIEGNAAISLIFDQIRLLVSWDPFFPLRHTS